MHVRVLLVDDSDMVCRRLETMLAEVEGACVVGSAKNFQGAVAFIEETNPDVIILDIQLLNSSGIDVLRELKKKELTPVVLMLTNYPYLQYRQKCMELGADYFLDKVTDIELIPEILKRILGRTSSNGTGPEQGEA